MRTIRVLVVLAVLLAIGLTAILPQVSYAQANPSAGPGKLFLPMTVNKDVPAQTAAVSQNPETLVSAEVSAAEQAATEKFWTRDRMLAAVPIDRIAATEAQVGAAQAAVAAAPSGPRGYAPASLPDAKAEALAQHADGLFSRADHESVTLFRHNLQESS